MEARFTASLDKLLTGSGSKQVILAVSGGIDSVVMAKLFRSSGHSFSIAHCNFQLRGDDSTKDEQFVRNLAEELGVEIAVKRFNTADYAEKLGISIQMAARELRYAWFNSLITNAGTVIATAHHANDNAETILFNLAKGTGLAGLHGMAAKGKKVIRPMLWAKKSDIEAYASNNDIDWREDQSNQSEKYMRNIIRAKIIPELERINPSFVEAGLRTAARVKDSEDFIEYCIDQLNLVEKREGVIYIDKSKLSVLPGKETVLYQLIRPYGFSYDQVNSIAEALSNTGAVFYSKEWFLNIDREQIILQKKILEEVDLQIRKGENLIELPIGNLAVVITDARKYKIQADPKIAAIDFDKLVFPLHLRVWQKGDYIIPLGMTGRKKVSDLLIDNKISMAIKQNLLVLVSNAEIVWVVGERISDRFKITRQTAKVFEIIWRQNH